MFAYLKKSTPLLLVLLLIYALPASSAGAESTHGKKQGGPPPSKVLVSTLRQGKISPQSDFIGTIYFKEVSEVAAETDGRVRTVYFEEGRRVKKGQTLISINPDMLSKEIESKKADRAEVISQLKKTKKDLSRATELFNKKLLAGKDYDQYKFAVEELHNKSLSLKAEIERLGIELSYKSVRSPFDGVVLSKKVERGEWVNPGTVVATVANDSEVYLIVNVPQKAIPFIRRGRPVSVYADTKVYKGVVHAIVPQGDLRTRTFPVKIRLTNRTGALHQGMEAGVSLPVGTEIKALLVNRDAVTSVMGQRAVYAAIEGKAVMLPVRVTGYKGSLVGISGKGLKAGMHIVTKGNERLRPGQPVIVINKGK